MSTISRGIRSVFRSKGRSIGAMVVLTICFMLGILMINVDVFASKKVASIKEELGTKVNLEIKSEYINEFINSKKGAEQYREDPFSFEEAVAEEISKDPHIISNQSIIGGTFYSEDLISSMELMMEELEDSGNVSFSTATIGGEGGEEEYDPLKMFLLTGVSDAKNLDEFVDKKFELVGGNFFGEHDVEKDVCLIASDFAKANNLDIGSTIVVNGESLKVKGIYKNVMVEDSSKGIMMGGGIDNIYMPLQTAQKLVGREGILNKSTFTVDSYDNVEKVVAASEEILKREGYEDKLRVYGDTSKFEKSVLALESVKNISKVGIFSAFGAALIIILSSMFVSVRGRAKEIGTLKAIGSSNSGIIKQFLVESLTICLIALFLGLILTSFANNYLVNNFILKGVRESELNQQEEIFEDRADSTGTSYSISTFGTSDEINGGNKIEEVLSQWDMGMDLRTILYASVFSIVVSLLGTAIPAIFIARLKPAQVIRFE